MKCSVVQRFLLEQARPERPPAAVRGHLDECPPCRAWHARLVEMERRVPLLSVPGSETARSAFLEQIVAATTEEKAAPRRRGWQVRERALQKLSLAASLAAALLLFALCWWVVQSTPQHPMNGTSQLVKSDHSTSQNIPVSVDSQEKVLERRRGRLHDLVAERSEPRTPVEYVARYHEVADALFEKVKHPRDGAERSELVQVFVLLMREELPRQARLVKREDREQVLRPVLRRLAEVYSEAKGLAEQQSGEDARAMKELVSAAESGQLELQRLLQEAAT